VHTEERVTKALHQILAGSTALVVAHRPSTVALADKVALLSGGVIAASGSHRELLATNAEYAALMDTEGLEASA
jgi:ATP-binding cassette subfamily B protein